MLHYSPMHAYMSDNNVCIMYMYCTIHVYSVDTNVINTTQKTQAFTQGFICVLYTHFLEQWKCFWSEKNEKLF